MKKLFLLFPVCLLVLVSMAQDNNFLLYSFKGNVSVVENKVESKAKIGKMLTSAVTLKIADGAAATLICNEAAMFTIKKAGSYSLTQFKDSCETHNSSFTSNYVKYVRNQM